MKTRKRPFNAQKLQQSVLAWYDQHGRKTLPWQQDKNPYRVWVSEIMLQQTQVKTVIDYFNRFMHRFPTLESLAAADLNEVLLYWAGLGYYSRARNLHKTAMLIHQRGRFPENVAELSALPGIGRSTAGAIVAIAFNSRATILDGNVKRVLARLHAIAGPINEKNVEDQLWQLAKHYTPNKRPGDFAQAMMDIGATCCTRKNPLCLDCALVKYCFAARQNIAGQLPNKTAARPLPIRQATFLIIKAGKKILLEQRPAKSIWGSLWSFPELSGHQDRTAIHCYCKQKFAINNLRLNPLTPFRHTFTHYHLEILPVIVTTTKTQKLVKKTAEQTWFEPHHLAQVAVPKPVQRLLTNWADKTLD